MSLVLSDEFSYSNDNWAHIDGDILLWRAAYIADRGSSPGFGISILTDLVDSIKSELDTEYITMYLTGNNNFRKHLYPPYKYHRKDKKPPKFINELKDFMLKYYHCVYSSSLEADDLLSINCTPGALDDVPFMNTFKHVLVTTDKDLDQVPCTHYNPVKGVLYDVSEAEAVRFLSAQILAGDPTDNIPGLRGVGMKTAFKIVDKTLEEYPDATLSFLMDNPVLQEYKKHYGDDGAEVMYLNYRLVAMVTSSDCSELNNGEYYGQA
jgi:DNA polymerase-1